MAVGRRSVQIEGLRAGAGRDGTKRLAQFVLIEVRGRGEVGVYRVMRGGYQNSTRTMPMNTPTTTTEPTTTPAPMIQRFKSSRLDSAWVSAIVSRSKEGRLELGVRGRDEYEAMLAESESGG